MAATPTPATAPVKRKRMCGAASVPSSIRSPVRSSSLVRLPKVPLAVWVPASNWLLLCPRIPFSVRATAVVSMEVPTPTTTSGTDSSSWLCHGTSGSQAICSNILITEIRAGVLGKPAHNSIIQYNTQVWKRTGTGRPLLKQKRFNRPQWYSTRGLLFFSKFQGAKFANLQIFCYDTIDFARLLQRVECAKGGNPEGVAFGNPTGRGGHSFPPDPLPFCPFAFRASPDFFSAAGLIIFIVALVPLHPYAGDKKELPLFLLTEQIIFCIMLVVLSTGL